MTGAELPGEIIEDAETARHWISGMVDVRAFKSGQKVRNTFRNKIFLVP